jgi:hypothetical protein
MTDFNAPWEYDDTRRAIFDADGTSVAFLPTSQRDPARARLLLAAPRLLKALQMLEDAENANANCTECDGAGVPELCPVCFPLFDDARLTRRALIAEIEGGGT